MEVNLIVKIAAVHPAGVEQVIGILKRRVHVLDAGIVHHGFDKAVGNATPVDVGSAATANPVRDPLAVRRVAWSRFLGRCSIRGDLGQGKAAEVDRPEIGSISLKDHGLAVR